MYFMILLSRRKITQNTIEMRPPAVGDGSAYSFSAILEREKGVFQSAIMECSLAAICKYCTSLNAESYCLNAG